MFNASAEKTEQSLMSPNTLKTDNLSKIHKSDYKSDYKTLNPTPLKKLTTKIREPTTP